MKLVSILQFIVLCALITVVFFWLGQRKSTIILESELQASKNNNTTTPAIVEKQPEPKPAPTKFTFTIAGDAMFGREVGYQFQNDFSQLFSDFDASIFTGKDISFINLEGPISDQSVEQQRRPDNLIFNFSKETINAIKYLKLTIVGLANNHTNNKGDVGLQTTKKMLDENGVDWIGGPSTIGESSIKRYEKDGIKISLIALNNLMSTSGVDSLVEKEKEDNRFVIMLPHLGNEYQTTHSSSQEKLAKEWFGAGADLIIGSHPHVVQDAQLIDGKLVIYSLGNFVFDQTFSDETQTGLIIGGKISKNKLEITLLPIQSIDLKPRIAKDSIRQKIIDRICINIQNYCSSDEIEISY